MSSGYTSKRFQCPFFTWDEKGKIHCEGGMVKLPMPELSQYVDQYCACHPGWKDCPIARELWGYYERTG